MSVAVKTSRKATFAMLAAGVTCAVLAIPTASATPAPVAADDCNAAGLSSTISTVTKALSEYFAAHPDVNQALIDATRQPSYVAVNQFEGYFDEHPQEADDIRAIKAPLGDFQNRCGLQVEPAMALVVLSEL